MFACVSGCTRDAGKKAAPGSYTVIDAQGTEVTIPAKPKRILTMSLGTDQIMLGLVETDRMVAVNDLLDDPTTSNVVELGKKVPNKIGYPSAEEIAAFQPDLVIIPDWGDLSRVAVLRDLGIPVVVCKGPRNLQDIKETITLLAQAAGEAERGDKLLKMMDAKLAEITAKVEQIPASQRRSVVLISLMKNYGGAGCTFDEACKLAGVINGQAAVGLKSGEVMTKEKLVEINPDIMFLPSYNNHGNLDIGSVRAEYVDDPSLQSLNAIKNGMLIEPDEGYIYNCSQDFVFGVQEIAYRVYGDSFRQGPQEHLTAVDN
ncbi:MAG: ABC transporter substrate-binding protein [Anaerovibrio sp.]|uniref:ABC transporter substrate-binding protein n=1 Tax=Anaerovibrio sp. TaxID=1872532 RepID=UPI0025D2410D|nr:ABC transporter substrate-binding protein [Anaerovibrio sp.]MCR5176412.1 ABC transporter substrate-binding protein [Anaerovibrio sp.]